MQIVDVWRSVVAEPEAGGRGKRCELAVGSAGDGSRALAGKAVAEAPGLVAGVDDVRAVGEAVDDVEPKNEKDRLGGRSSPGIGSPDSDLERFLALWRVSAPSRKNDAA